MKQKYFQTANSTKAADPAKF